MIANTIEAAPLKPVNEIKRFWFALHFKGERIAKTVTGRATKVINKAMAKEGRKEIHSDRLQEVKYPIK